MTVHPSDDWSQTFTPAYDPAHPYWRAEIERWSGRDIPYADAVQIYEDDNFAGNPECETCGVDHDPQGECDPDDIAEFNLNPQREWGTHHRSAL